MSQYLKYFCQQLNLDFPKITVSETYIHINHYGGDSEKVFDGYKAETLFNGKHYWIKSFKSREDAKYKLCQ